MPTFEEFVQSELPRRPFVVEDGLPGQIPARSSNPAHPLEMVWVNLPQNELTLEAGENLGEGAPVKVVGGKFYTASHMTDGLVVGLTRSAATATFPATAAMSGPFTGAGFVAQTPYFLGDGVITNTPPSTGYVVRIGTAVTASVLLINIEEPILLV